MSSTIRRWVVLVLVFAGILISYLDRGNLSLAVVPIMNEFGYSSTKMGILLSCFFWTYASFQIPSGILIDRYGIRRTYAGAFLVWCCASAAVGLSHNFSELLTFRLVLGSAESFGPLASLAFIRTSFSKEEQGLPTSLYVAGLTAGPAVGALLGSYILGDFGWRWLFVLTGAGALIWLIPWLILVPEDAKCSDRSRSEPLATPWAVALRQPGLWAMTSCVFLFSYYWYFVLTWVPSYLTLVHKFSVIEMGKVLSIPLFAMALLSIVAGFIADRMVRRGGHPFSIRVWFCGSGLAGAACVLLLLIIPDRTWVLPVLLVSMCSMGVASSSFWALAQLTVPAEIVGRGMGYLNMMAQIAGAAAPLITGWLLGPEKRFDTALLVAGICPLLASAALLGVGGTRVESLREALDSEMATRTELNCF
jgi:MFS family permease